MAREPDALHQRRQRRPRLRQQIRNREIFCIYCAGESIAETVDHMPPIVIFHNNHRPEGLEFPACEDCNRSARITDTVVGLLSRLYPPSADRRTDAEVSRLLQAVANNAPGALEEMHVSTARSRRQLAREGLSEELGLLNVGGPIIQSHLEAFAARQALAMHYMRLGSAVPRAGGVVCRTFTNLDAALGGIPDDLFRLVGEPDTLRQGRGLEVSDQFLYAARAVEERTMVASYSLFRQSLAFFTISAINVSHLTEAMTAGARVIIPGQFRATALPSYRLSFTVSGIPLR